MSYPIYTTPLPGSTPSYPSTTGDNVDAIRNGNNPYGSLGTYKCSACRDRRKKCEFTDWNQPCSYCASQNLANCVKMLAPQPREQSQDFTHPQLQSTTTQSSSKVSDMAKMYETTYPTATPQQIVQYLVAAFSVSQQQQSQQTQYQAQPLPTQQTQSTQNYYTNPYVNQSYPSYHYNSGVYDNTQSYPEICNPEF